MQIIDINEKNTVARAVKTIRSGGIVVFPTDTAYGLGVDATNNGAVEKLFILKGRAKDKPMHVVVSDIDMANHYGVMDKRARALAQAFLPGPVTLVVRDKGRVPKSLIAGGDTIGIRIPNADFTIDMVRALGTPITATSANKSGDAAPYAVSDVKGSFGEKFKEINLVVDAGALPNVIPSTLVGLTGDEPRILREGPISREEIERVLG